MIEVLRLAFSPVSAARIAEIIKAPTRELKSRAVCMTYLCRTRDRALILLWLEWSQHTGGIGLLTVLSASALYALPSPVPNPFQTPDHCLDRSLTLPIYENTDLWDRHTRFAYTLWLCPHLESLLIVSVNALEHIRGVCHEKCGLC